MDEAELKIESEKIVKRTQDKIKSILKPYGFKGPCALRLASVMVGQALMIMGCALHP